MVVSWQFGYGTKFANVKTLLESLKNRFETQESLPKIILVDNCCQWRDCLQTIFIAAIILLDLFHAVLRITSTIPKKKGATIQFRLLRKQLVRSFKMVFRSYDDMGPSREKPTPSPEIIEGNIDKFLRQWKDVKCDDVQLISKKTNEAIDNLLVHVRKGCLSNIPPSAGTNRNEGLHRILNKTFRKSRIGLQSAIALLGKFFYRWNQLRQSTKLKVIKPIEHWKKNFVSLFN